MTMLPAFVSPSALPTLANTADIPAALPLDAATSLRQGLRVSVLVYLDETIFTVHHEDYRLLCERLYAAGFEFPCCLTGTDMDYGLRVQLSLQRFPGLQKAGVRTDISYDTPTLPTVSDLWGGVEWHEREAYDLLGIHFSGHRDLRRLLLEDDWTIHPLQRRYNTRGYLLPTWSAKAWPDPAPWAMPDPEPFLAKGAKPAPPKPAPATATTATAATTAARESKTIAVEAKVEAATPTPVPAAAPVATPAVTSGEAKPERKPVKRWEPKKKDGEAAPVAEAAAVPAAAAPAAAAPVAGQSSIAPDGSYVNPEGKTRKPTKRWEPK
jgi:NADH:ubiquinone oxidoreductase subunit C